MSSNLDVHFYDNKLLNSFNFKYNREEKIKEFIKFKNNLTINPLINENILRSLDVLIRDTETIANFDHTNNLMADDILYFIIENIKDNQDILKELLIQLEDIMLKGQCSQGRCIRLLQIKNLI